jgi:hypothetical protein
MMMTGKKSQSAYRAFIEAGFFTGHVPHLTAHGVEKGDERIPGNTDFVMKVLRDAAAIQQRQVNVRSESSLLDLIQEEYLARQINPGEVQNGGRLTGASEARAAIAHWAATEFGLPAAEIARRLGVTTASITKAVEKIDKRLRGQYSPGLLTVGR